MKSSGIYEFQGSIGFKFGMIGGAHAERLAQCSFAELIEKVRSVNGGQLMAILHLFQGAAISYTQRKGLPAPTQEQVEEWLEEIGLDEAKRIMTEVLTGPQDPNPIAPA